MKTAADRALEKAKLQLMMKPETLFYSTILFSLTFAWDTKIKTAGTDGTGLFINPLYFKGLSEPERIGLLVHEVMHVALNHMTRIGPRDHKLWNYAGDYVINNMLIKSKYTLPPTDLINKDYNKLNTEQIYKILADDSSKNPNGMFGKNGSGVKGLGLDIQYPKNSKKAKKIKQDVATIVQKATMQAQAVSGIPGVMPGEMLIQLEKVINPKLPWNVLLLNYFTQFAKDNFTWQKPNRRYMPDFYLPTAYSESICNIAEAVDSSGSVLKHEFSFFIRETQVIQEVLKPEKITLIDFDTRIRSIQEITKDTDILRELKFTGGGGTDVREVLKWAQINKPDVLLFFTDGEFQMPNKSYYPTCPVIWLIHGDPNWKAPFGKVVHYDIKN